MALNNKIKSIINRIKNKLAIPKIAREWLNKEYPKNDVCRGQFDKKNNKGKRREEIEELDINSEVLKGWLDLNDFENLKILRCENNKISFLDIRKLTRLETLNCSINKIEKLDLSENTALRILRCHKNPLLVEIIGLEKLKELTTIDSGPFFKPIDQLRKIVFKDILDEDIGYNSLLQKEINACREVATTLSEDIPQEQKEQAQQEMETYEAKMLQIVPWKN